MLTALNTNISNTKLAQQLVLIPTALMVTIFNGLRLTLLVILLWS